ncbi:hypothetical protein BB559_003632 [Furculomyces boomerangus]|uniref:Dolichyl-phosphate-mannose--protein mannosyltransferase n=2 Tax=Harpellales TaxID=61421 RepID=A0A2T9YK28_9FUNG|nr:hypothetical protein BB559_003632 [Furculomyces boomerangus]
MSLFSEYNGIKKPMVVPINLYKEVLEKKESLFYYHEINAFDHDTTQYKKHDEIKESSFFSDFNFNNLVKWSFSHKDLVLSILVTLLSFITRTYKIGAADRVIWDEAHFGKFGGYYVKGTFYHDVHPPLAKMLVGLSEYLTGFDGVFEFESGDDFPDDTNYVFIRMFNAMFGISMVPFAYFTMLNFGCSSMISTVASLFIVFENATCTISRFILLDGILLCFTAMSLYFLSGMYAYRKSPFTTMWWINLAMTGVSLGLVSSSKWVGLFAVALVGLYTIEELYDLLGDSSLSMKKYFKHWASRIVFLIIVPCVIYLVCFKIHFMLLFKTGPGDSVMPSLFQASLLGNSIGDQPLEVVFGSKVTFKAPGDVGLLHSHPHNYPQGSGLQQITCYGHKDSNNEWVITKAFDDNFDAEKGPIEHINNLSIVRLLHKQSGAYLISNNRFKGPVTTKYYEVSGQKNLTELIKPNEALWSFEVDSDHIKSKDNNIHALSTKFRLRNVETGCYLRTSGKTLPGWGFSQQEVVCSMDKAFGEDSVNTVWNIEAHVNSRLPKGDLQKIKPSFFSSFLHLNKAMFSSNNALLPDEDKIDELTSEPLDWPILRLGLRMCSYDDTDYKFFLIGNPLIWWTSTLLLILYPFQILYHLIRMKRGFKQEIFSAQGLRDYFYPATILWAGWFLHYLPFFIMGRVTYLHHYFPSVYFGALFMALQLGYFAQKFKHIENMRHLIPIVTILVILNFWFFAPFTFGFDYSPKLLKSRRWLSSWKMY